MRCTTAARAGDSTASTPFDVTCANAVPLISSALAPARKSVLMVMLTSPFLTPSEFQKTPPRRMEPPRRS
jgi:hypothetical protein